MRNDDASTGFGSGAPRNDTPYSVSIPQIFGTATASAYRRTLEILPGCDPLDLTSTARFVVSASARAVIVALPRPTAVTVAESASVLPTLLLDVKRSFEPQAAEFAGRIAAEPYHILTAAGSCWPCGRRSRGPCGRGAR